MINKIKTFSDDKLLNFINDLQINDTLIFNQIDFCEYVQNCENNANFFEAYDSICHENFSTSDDYFYYDYSSRWQSCDKITDIVSYEEIEEFINNFKDAENVQLVLTEYELIGV